MKSLTLFLVSVLLLQVYVNSSHNEETFSAVSNLESDSEAGNFAKYSLTLGGPSKKGKTPTKKIGSIKKGNSKSKGAKKGGKTVPKSIAARVAAMKLLKAKKEALAYKRQHKYSDGDKLVCGYGQNLGLLQNDQHCRSTHLSKCRNIIGREKNAPRYSKVAAVRALFARIAGKGKNRKNRRKKWSLKNRRYHIKRFRAVKRRLAARRARSYRAKLTPQQKRRKYQRKAATRMLNRMLDNRNKQFSFKKIQSMAKRMGNKRFYRKNKNRLTRESLRRLLKSPLAKRIIAKHTGNTPAPSKPSDSGDYCVHAVEYNLNYCCYFSSRIEAQEFANTQPDEFTFNRMLVEGRMASKRDKERRARKAAKRIARALALLRASRRNRRSRKGRSGRKALRSSGKKGSKFGKSSRKFNKSKGGKRKNGKKSKKSKKSKKGKRRN
jgi:hypothetical protein